MIMGQSFETSDFIVDCLERWWIVTLDNLSHINELVRYDDNGPSLLRLRTQFIKRMVEFEQSSKYVVKLVYYPPYSLVKYNPIERCLTALESYFH